ncbi:hypothetical protein CTI12_AA518770 [Artemisia annua]|uniref:RRM domain-containing protein n=1 Tax=Artemisia annua TaxID=35608 RepID=A0A2U1L8J1_ARTAN|nr:hypothetical protein CTI12_AA518770 [Artemisia annua]
MAVSSDEDENGGYDREGKKGTKEGREWVKVNQRRKVTNGETQEKFHGESEASLKDKGDGERKEKWKHVPCRNVVNYFFTNFPPEWNQANLRDIFMEFGEVVDVYVARKMSKVGLRFGFARFLRVGNLKVLEKRLNQIWNGRLKLRANVAKILLEFRNKEGKYHSTTDCRESKRDAEMGEEEGNTSDLESSSTEPIFENGFKSIPVKLKYNFPATISPFPKTFGQKLVKECSIDIVTSLSKARASREFNAEKVGSDLGGLVNSNSVVKSHGLCSVDIMNGTTLQIQASNIFDFLIKRKIRTLNLFELVSKSKKSLPVINEMKKVSQRLRSAEALKFLRQLAF